MLRTARILLALTAGLFSGPEGAEAAHTDGYAVTQTLNARQLPEVLRTTKAGAETPVWLSYGYDSQRKITSVADLDGAGANEGRSYGYDANGRLLTAAGAMGTNGAQVAGSLKYDALGNIREQKLGTRTIAISYHAAANRVSSANNGGVNRAYGYDARGKVTQLVNWAVAGEDRSFGYDANGRLVSSTGPWGSGSYVYDALGNMRQRNEGTAGSSTISYDASNRVSQSVVTGLGTRAYVYDARGNTTGVGGQGFTYDYSNQPVALYGAVTASYAYDGNLKRVKEVRSGKTVYTVYSRVSGGLVFRDEATDNKTTSYLSAGGASVRLTSTGGGAPVAEYIHNDHLGSPVAATNGAGAVVWRESYTPFGAERLNPAANDNSTGYTGHLKDDASGLVYMQARYYDPLVPRFLSTDPIGYQDQLNLYAYVHNDPVNFWDPLGLCGTKSENYQDCTINVEDRDKLSADQLKSVETYEAKIRETGAAIAKGGTDEEVAAWESIDEFNINPNRNDADSPNAAATADVEGGSVNIWKTGVDNVTSRRNNPSGSVNGDSAAGHIVMHEVYHFTASDIARRAAIDPTAISAPLRFRNAEIANDRAAVAAAKRLSILPADYSGQAYRIGGF